MRRIAAASVALALGCMAPNAVADPGPSASRPSPYRFDFVLEAPIVLVGGAMAMTVLVPPTRPSCLPHCEPPSNMLGIDARVLGNHSPTARSAADIMVLTLLFAPHLVNFVARGPSDLAWLEDVTISMESALVAQGLTQVTKAATGRHAPLVYDDTVPIEERTSTDALRSFWSGHTATAFAAATSFAVSYWARHPRDPWRWVVLAALESAALCTGLLKIRAGYHYPTDVLAGAAAGIGSGILVPALHMRW